MRVLLVGSGYVGAPLIGHLQTRGCEVFATTTTPEKLPLLQKLGAKSCLFDEALFDAVDAFVVTVAPHRGVPYRDCYLKVAHTLEKHPPSYLVYTSSTSVYGAIEGVVDEDTECLPEDDNGKILLETERVFLSFPSRVCVLRLGGIFGPGRGFDRRTRMMSGKVMEGNPDAFTNHTHLDTILEGIDVALKTKFEGVYNLVEDAHPTRRALYDAVAKELQIPPPLWQKGNQSRGKIVSNKKIVEKGITCKFTTTSKLLMS